MTVHVVNLIHSWASLLSGDLSDCLTPDDPSCRGGVAAVSAHIRHLVPTTEPALVVPRLDKTSAFVQMHPMGWNVNKLVFQDLLNWSVFASSPSLLTANTDDFGGVPNRDLSLLQSRDLPFLLTNAIVLPNNSWYYCTEAIHFDERTGLAVLSIADSGQTLNAPQIESAVGALDFIAKLNDHSLSCGSNKSGIFHAPDGTNVTFVDTWSDGSSPRKKTCWSPIIFYADTDPDRFRDFLSAITKHRHPPALIVDVEMNDASYVEPKLVHNTWVVSHGTTGDGYYQHRITLDKSAPSHASNVEVVLANLNEMPAEYKDDIYSYHITQLRALADEASLNDPIVGSTLYPMPAARYSEGTYRRCKGGECEIGNLFADALKWRARSDVAFISSGGVRGSGWEGTDVRTSDLWASLPFPNTMCTGTISGLSLFRLLDYSIGIATFQSADTQDGGRLLQVSGMKVVYNTKIKGSRIVSVDIQNDRSGKFSPIDRLRLYSFATDSYLCGVYDPFPSLLRDHLVLEGEKPGVISDMLHQNIVGEFLAQLDKPYNNSIQGRLQNDTDVTTVLDFIQTEEDCSPDTFWVEKNLTCMPCPDFSNVVFSDKKIVFEATRDTNEKITGRVALVNRELFPVSVQKESLPSWAELTSLTTKWTNSVSSATAFPKRTVLAAGESMAIEFDILSYGLKEGTAQGTFSFQVLDHRESFRGCIGKDISFSVHVRVHPSLKLNHLGWIRAVGLALMSIACLTSIALALWVLNHRKNKIVSALQPYFLVAICFGVFIISTAIIPLSVDDGIASALGCDIACMATPWIVSMGLAVAFSALFSKLWRINKVFSFSKQMRRVHVKERVFFVVFSILFSLNFIFLMTWTLLDPLRWKRHPVDGQSWSTYGTCEGNGSVSRTMLSLTIVVNSVALVLAFYEAFKARNISDKYSESKYLGVALYSWLQLGLVGVPVLFLIDNGNPSAKYFLHVAFLFAVGISMLLLIFAPILRKLFCRSEDDEESSRNSVVRISGIKQPGTGLRLSLAASGNNDGGAPLNEIMVSSGEIACSSLCLPPGSQESSFNVDLATE